MNILVTGAKGFIGKNLVAELRNQGHTDIMEYDKDTEEAVLYDYCEKADFIYHLAGINRPREETEYREGNYGFTKILLQTLKNCKNTCPIMVSSSIQANLQNPYGKSKKAAEDLLFEYAKEYGVPVYVYRLPNVFGKWCKPNYNGVIATFCYYIARNLPITIEAPDKVLNLAYIDDVLVELIGLLNNKEPTKGKFCKINTVYSVTLIEIANLLYSFQESRSNKAIPDMGIPFVKKIYAVYLSYLPEEEFSYALDMNCDHRGSFTEFVKSLEHGQVSINISKPGITKGNHWHHTKNEKFLVVSGKGVIRLRKVFNKKIIELFVSGDKLEVVDIPVGYTHNIENLGDTDMVTVMWANEYYDPDKPDTYYLEV